jgi:hypothetical protein
MRRDDQRGQSADRIVRACRDGRSGSEVDGQPSGTAVRIRIWRRDMNRQLWNVLTGAGA